MFRIPLRHELHAAKRFAKQNGINYLLAVDQDPKTAKSNRLGVGYLTAIQYLAPARVSGHDVCQSASDGCTTACLHTAGMPFIQQAKNKARIARTRFYFEHRQDYFRCLYAEVVGFTAKCKGLGLKPAVRLNGTSDIVWEKVAPWLFEVFPSVQFYDYTKHERRMLGGWKLPKNYHLTFSRSETNGEAVARVLADNPGAKVAVVF